jgi:transcription factor 1
MRYVGSWVVMALGSPSLIANVCFLTDDVLTYMAPLLEKHKGCDILDLNPGVGLWSSKLHDFLRPRSHILLEGSPRLYQPYLQPLLDQPGSTYKLYEGDISQFSTFDTLIAGGAFPYQKRVASDAPHSQELNNSLLVTGTLIWDPPLPGLGFTSLAGQLFGHFAKWSWTNQGFHAFGPARMLFWGLNEDVRYILPKGAHAIAKSSFFIPRTTNVSQIVTIDHPSRPKTRAVRRQPRYEIESLVQALKRGKDNGFELPAHRRENIHDFADDIAKMTDGTGILSFTECQKYLKEQENLGKSTEGFLNSQVYEQMLREKSLPDEDEPKDLKVARYRATAKKYEGNRVKVDEAVDLGEAIYHLECKILAMEDGPDKDAQLARLHEMDSDFERRVGGINKNLRPSVYTELDDRIALRSAVPRLEWDQRPFEPLVLRPGEVWPEAAAGLYDMVPRPRPSDVSLEDWEYEQDFITAASQRSTSSLPTVLDSVQHGGSAIIEEVPILRDPKKGGRLNMNHMRARMLTLEMMEALSKAYREWPFRNPDTSHPHYFRLRDGKGGANRSPQSKKAKKKA